MTKQIKCPFGNLEDFIKYGEQVPAYRCFRGNLDSQRFKQKTIDYYNLGKEYAEQFEKGMDFLESLKEHAENCRECSEEMKELRDKYDKMDSKGIGKLNGQVKKNLEYFGLISKKQWGTRD